MTASYDDLVVATRNADHHVVIIGAGFGGMAVAKKLRRKQCAVTLVDERDFHTFQPLLYEVATAGLDPDDVAYPVRAVFGRNSNVRFCLGRVTRIDMENRRVHLVDPLCTRGATTAPPTSVAFDSLIISSGASVAFFGVPGAKSHAHPLYTLEDARRLRDRILSAFELAERRRGDPVAGDLNFVIVGGGPTGVEMAGAIHELIGISNKRDGFRFNGVTPRVVVVDAMDHLLDAFNPSARKYAAKVLQTHNVELKLGVKVSRITCSQVEFDDGFVIPAKTVIWAGGVSAANTLVGTLELPVSKNGRLLVDSNLNVSGHFDVFAIGDAAAIPQEPGSSELCPQLAQVAIQSGRHAAGQIVAQLNQRHAVPFRYKDKGIMATIGRRAAVAQFPGGTVIRGTLGWVAWLTLHLFYLLGVRNRVTALTNWSWRYLSWTSGPRTILEQDSTDLEPVENVDVAEKE